jgi:Tfp pilus assembly protein PilO
MSTPAAPLADWGFFEWATACLIGATSGLSVAIGWIFGQVRRIDRLAAAEAQLRIDVDAGRAESKAAAAKIEALRDDHFELREMVAQLPKRDEMREMLREYAWSARK